MNISKVGVLGCGLMGHGIAQICAQAGWDVVVVESDQGALDKGIGKITKQLSRSVEKGKLEQADADAVLNKINATLDYAELAECDLVIEAITENLDAKLEMWGKVDEIVKGEAFFATNTSSLSVADQAAATGRAERFLGMHFFNPPQVMPLLEVVRAESTSDEAYDVGFAVGEKLGKTTVAAGDNRGFIVNRLLVPYLFDAMRAYEQGVGSIEDIDRGMIAGASHPMGPLTLSDFVGLDTLASIGDVLIDYYGEERMGQPDVLRRLVAAGHYGRKSGRGFYDYSGEKPVAEPSIERIRNATFPLSVRGYDRTQVDAFLAEIADWLETGGGGGAAAEEATRNALERVGEQTAAILTEAHRAAQEIRDSATAGVRQQLLDANATAEKVREEAAEYAADARDEADAYSRKVRGDADAYASRTTAEIESELAEDRETAKKEAERIVADAHKRKADIESVIGDLERRRDAVLGELDRLASGITGTASQHRDESPDAGSDPDETDDFELLPADGSDATDESEAETELAAQDKSDKSDVTEETRVIAAEKD